ncbi:hypothetical protein QCA50_004831 [Cerrena zonata]|uniref:Uncharacterized protein n=1 Tax=Cerrena zonata TaxID=2478898 RepID=A0AAW0GFM9_9APHY
MYSALDITGLVLGILGLSGTVLLVRYLLPKHRIASLERGYASAYSLYQCSIAEGLLLPSEQKLILRRTRTQLNDVKNNVTCLGGTWGKILSTLKIIYRILSTIDSTIHSICIQIASSSQKGKERLKEHGIPYEPCLFPLATTVNSLSMESFKMGDHCDPVTIHQLFPSQQELSHISSNTSDDVASVPNSEHIRSISPLPRNAAPRHRDSVSSTATTVVEESSSCDVRLDIAADTTPEHYGTESAVRGELDPSRLLRLLPASSQKEADPSDAVNSYCTDLQGRLNLLQSVLSPPQTSESPTTQNSNYSADLEKCKEDLLAVMGRLSKVSDIWVRRETGPVLPI